MLGERRVLDIKSIRPIDAAIAGILALILIIGTVLGVSIYRQSHSVRETTPVSRALDDLISQVKKDPNNIVLRMNLAQTLAIAGRERESIEQYQAVLKVKEDYPPALAGLGFIALRKQDWETGEKYYRKIIELREGSVNTEMDNSLEVAYFYLGTALMEQKEYEEAAVNLTKALRIRGDASDTHYALAICFRELENPRKYKAALETALTFDPKMPEANYDYAQLLLEEGDIASAAEHLRTSADAAPKDDRPADALAKLGSAEGRLSKAKQLAKKDIKQALVQARVAVALAPKDTDGMLLLASLYEKDHNPDLARGVYRQIISLDPLNEDANAGLERVGR